MRNTSFAISISLACVFSACSQQQKTLVALQAQQIAPAPQTVSVTISGYAVQSAGNAFQNIFVNNFSVKASQGTLTYMTSRDMPDALKLAHTTDYNFTTASSNSAMYPFGDLFLYLAGITTASQSLLYCPANQMLSSSGDGFQYNDSRYPVSATPPFLGLRDCEKLYMGLNPATPDYDGDGIPDYLELRCGLNPKNLNDANLSIGGDGVTNLQKCQQGIPIDESANSQPNKLFASVYNTTVQSDRTRTFSVTNIPVLNGGQDNFIAIYVMETNSVLQKSFVHANYAILPAGSAGKTFTIPFWPSTQDTLGVTLP